MSRFWSKFEFRQWRDDKELKRCCKETRGFWIDCIVEMEDQETYFLEGTPDELCRVLNSTRKEFDRSVAELERTNAASVTKNQGLVKIVSRRLLKVANLREYNRLKQREHRRQETVKPASNAPSKELEIKTLREEEFKKKEEKKIHMSETSSDVDVIFAYWQAALNHPNAKMTTERQTAIRARLREGYSVQQLIQAIDGCKNSPHHQGENDRGIIYDDLTLICRNGSKVEQFIGYLERKEINNGINQKSTRGHLDLADELERIGRAEREREAERGLLGSGGQDHFESDFPS